MPAPVRNIEEETKLLAHPIYRPLFYKLKEAMRERLKHPGDYLSEVHKTDEVLHLLEGIAGESAFGEAILDLLAYTALQTVRERDDFGPGIDDIS